jgi:arabinose-5-phosphate isomerase
MPQPSANPSQFVRVEAEALARLADRIDGAMASAFEQALRLMQACSAAGQRVVVTGVGKSGLVGQKIVATFNSTGTRALFLHPVEAVHGDLGAVAPRDVVLALSYSGETEEVLRLLPAFVRLSVPLISMSGCATSTLAAASAVTLDISVSEEACSLNLAPTASTTVMLALGDALALELSRRSGFEPQDFADLHPGGRLGRRLARVGELMHTGEALPRVSPTTRMPEVIYEMSRKKLGMTTVLAGDDHAGGATLAGIISDGDLRRLLERVGPQAFERTAGEIMNRTPLTIGPGTFASEALERMEERKITSLVVVEDELVLGVIHLHDLWQLAPK